MASPEIAATYAALILADDGIEITADKIITLTSAANVDIEPIWATLLAKALEAKNVKELLLNLGLGGGGGGTPAAGSAPTASTGALATAKVQKEEEEMEESDVEIGFFGLFDD